MVRIFECDLKFCPDFPRCKALAATGKRTLCSDSEVSYGVDTYYAEPEEDGLFVKEYEDSIDVDGILWYDVIGEELSSSRVYSDKTTLYQGMYRSTGKGSGTSMFMDIKKSVSVVLVASNDAEVLPDSLRVWVSSCISCPDGSELIICDANSTDGTEELVEEFMEKHKHSGLRIVYVKSGSDNPVEAANLARGACEGARVLFVTGSSYPNGRAIEEYSVFMEDNVGLVGIQKFIKVSFNYGTVVDDSISWDFRFKNIHDDEHPWEVLPDNNVMIEKHLLDRVGWLNDGFSTMRSAIEELVLVLNLSSGMKMHSVERASLFVVGKENKDKDEREQEWIRQLRNRYEAGRINRSTSRLKPRPPKSN